MRAAVAVEDREGRVLIGCMFIVPLKVSYLSSDSQRVRSELSTSIAHLASSWGHPFQTSQSMPSDMPSDVAILWKWMDLHGLGKGRNDQLNSLPDEA